MNHSIASSTVFWLLYLLVLFPLIIFTYSGFWKMFKKAGRPGWAILIPFYNIYCIFDMAWGKGWLFLLMLVPFVNVVIGIITCVKLAAAFGRSGWFGLGLVLLPTVFALILGWGTAEYIGPQ